MNLIKKSLHIYRFELFLATLVFNLFGILLFNDVLFTNYLFPIGLLLNIVTGINLILNKKTKALLICLFFASAFTSGFAMFDVENVNLDLLKFGFYFIFYVVIMMIPPKLGQ